MANHKSAEKRARQAKRKQEVNKRNKSIVRTAIKALRQDIAANNVESSQKKFVEVQSLLRKLAKSSAMRKLTASRLTSRLAVQVNKLAQ